MRRFGKMLITAAAGAALAACADGPSTPITSDNNLRAISLDAMSSEKDDFVPGEVLVKVKEDADLREVAKSKGLALGRIGFHSAFAVFHSEKGSEEATANDLKRDTRVEWAEPNYLRHLTNVDSRLWAFFNPGSLSMSFADGTGPIPSSYASIVDADEDNVSNYAVGGDIVTIGSIDTGVQFNHEQFAAGQLIAGRDWIDGDDDPSDEDGHGTHTAGTMIGRTVGIVGVSGAGTNVRLYVQRVCGSNGCPVSAIINAITAATSFIDAQGHHLVAVNLSLGGGTESTGERNAIAAATLQGVPVIASAGNNGTGKVACPACDANAIAVAASTWKDEKATYSQYGKALDIAAPGGYCYANTSPEGCIYSAYLGSGTSTYRWLMGTSMAAPQVTGTAGIVASVTKLRGMALRARLFSTVDTPAAFKKYGVGRLNAFRAVTAVSLPQGQ